MDSDDPPPLDGIPGQLEALQRPKSSPAVQTAAVTVQAYPKPARTLQKGFLNKKPAAKSPASQNKHCKAAVVEEIISGPGRPSIPQGFIIPPSPEEVAAQKARDRLVAALKPDENTVQQVLANPALLAGFDDPDVMRAVNDIAKNPANLQKYQANPKVNAFYKQMSGLLATKCESQQGSG